MSSKIAIFIAIFLFFLSWCVPAVDGMVGFGVMVTSILYHFLIVPIPQMFPVWANLTFLLAVRCWEHLNPKHGCMVLLHVFLCVLDFLQQLLKLMWVL